MEKKIFLDQCGYKEKGIKHVTFLSDKPVDFTVVPLNSKKEPVTFKTDKKIENKASDEVVYVGDFSELTEPGVYRVDAEGLGESEYFHVGNAPYDECITSAIRFFYLQRCGMALTREEAGIFEHEVCHSTDALIYGTDQKINVNGGWHDAGDYGKYVGPGAMAVAQLLMAYDTYGRMEELCRNPKKENNELPALLEEIKYEIDWMMKMQNEKGELYHKVTCRNFCGHVVPEMETDELVISPASVTATADFAAACAMAVRFYEPYDKAYARKLEEVSKKAYDAAMKMELPGGFKNPEEIVTGEYGDACDIDEKYWAAAELYKAFGDEKYRSDFEAVARDKIYEGYGWEDMGSYGNAAYLTCGREITKEIKEKIEGSVTARAEELLKTVSEEGYEVSLKKDEYIWGSNLTVANHGIQLLDAYHLTKEEKYLHAAWQQIHYLHGRNPMGVCYLSGNGTTPVLRPHHRPSAAVGKAMPGMLSGGPCDWMADEPAKEFLEGKGVAPAKCFLDMTGSYSTNEVTIYWNSAYLLLLAGLLSEMEK